MRPGAAVPLVLALSTAVFSATWPVAQAVSAGAFSLGVVAFALALALGFAFVGALAGTVLDALSRATLGAALRLPRAVAFAVLAAALALGAWFGRAPSGG